MPSGMLLGSGEVRRGGAAAFLIDRYPIHSFIFAIVVFFFQPFFIEIIFFSVFSLLILLLLLLFTLVVVLCHFDGKIPCVLVVSSFMGGSQMPVAGFWNA